MPHSAAEGRPWMVERLALLDPASMLDIGAGAGTYGQLFQRHFPRAWRVGVEVWEPYIDRFDLTSLYDEVHVNDVRTLDRMPDVDVVILGDVLEHMTTDEAVRVWATARAAAQKAVFLSIPVVHYPQGALEGNPHEIHVVDDYTHERVLDTFDGITSSWTGQIVGVYEASPS